jgi:hypothetical protein
VPPVSRVSSTTLPRALRDRRDRLGSRFRPSRFRPTSLRPRSASQVRPSSTHRSALTAGWCCRKVNRFAFPHGTRVMLSPIDAQGFSVASAAVPFAGVAQSVEHLFCKQVVRGSSPLASSVVLVGGRPAGPPTATCEGFGRTGGRPAGPPTATCEGFGRTGGRPAGPPTATCEGFGRTGGHSAGCCFGGRAPRRPARGATCGGSGRTGERARRRSAQGVTRRGLGSGAGKTNLVGNGHGMSPVPFDFESAWRVARAANGSRL